MTETTTRQRIAAEALKSCLTVGSELNAAVAVVSHDRHIPTPAGMADIEYLEYVVEASERTGCVHRMRSGIRIGGLRPSRPEGWRSHQEVAEAAMRLLRREGQLRPGERYSVAVFCDCPLTEATPVGCRLCRDQVIYFPDI